METTPGQDSVYILHEPFIIHSFISFSTNVSVFLTGNFFIHQNNITQQYMATLNI